MARYVMEGTWTGYVSRQSRVVHREVVPTKRADALKGLHKIVYTDGTALLISVRVAEPREPIQAINSYGELIREAEKSGKNVYVIGRDDKAAYGPPSSAEYQCSWDEHARASAFCLEIAKRKTL